MYDKKVNIESAELTMTSLKTLVGISPTKPSPTLIEHTEKLLSQRLKYLSNKASFVISGCDSFIVGVYNGML